MVRTPKPSRTTNLLVEEARNNSEVNGASPLTPKLKDGASLTAQNPGCARSSEWMVEGRRTDRGHSQFSTGRIGGRGTAVRRRRCVGWCPGCQRRHPPQTSGSTKKQCRVPRSSRRHRGGGQRPQHGLGTRGGAPGAQGEAGGASCSADRPTANNVVKKYPFLRVNRRDVHPSPALSR